MSSYPLNIAPYSWLQKSTTYKYLRLSAKHLWNTVCLCVNVNIVWLESHQIWHGEVHTYGVDSGIQQSCISNLLVVLMAVNGWVEQGLTSNLTHHRSFKTQCCQPISWLVPSLPITWLIATKLNLNKQARKPLTYAQTTANKTKAWFRGPGNGLRLFHSSRGGYGASTKLSVVTIAFASCSFNRWQHINSRLVSLRKCQKTRLLCNGKKVLHGQCCRTTKEAGIGPNIDISLQSGWFWAASIASCTGLKVKQSTPLSLIYRLPCTSKAQSVSRLNNSIIQFIIHSSFQPITGHLSQTVMQDTVYLASCSCCGSLYNCLSLSSTAMDTSSSRFCSCHELFLCFSVSMNLANMADWATCRETNTLSWLA